MKSFAKITLSVALVLSLSLLVFSPSAHAWPTTDPLVEAVLQLSTDIGDMADRIGEMADRIVEVNQTSQENAIIMTQISEGMVNGNTFLGADGIEYQLIMVPVNP